MSYMERLPHATNGQNICHSSDGPDSQYVRVIGSVWVYICVLCKNLGLFHFFTIFSTRCFNTSLLDYFLFTKICSISEHNLILKCKQSPLGLLNQIVSCLDSWLMLALLQSSTLEHSLNHCAFLDQLKRSFFET